MKEIDSYRDAPVLEGLRLDERPPKDLWPELKGKLVAEQEWIRLRQYYAKKNSIAKRKLFRVSLALTACVVFSVSYVSVTLFIGMPSKNSMIWAEKKLVEPVPQKETVFIEKEPKEAIWLQASTKKRPSSEGNTPPVFSLLEENNENEDFEMSKTPVITSGILGVALGTGMTMTAMSDNDHSVPIPYSNIHEESEPKACSSEQALTEAMCRPFIDKALASLDTRAYQPKAKHKNMGSIATSKPIEPEDKGAKEMSTLEQRIKMYRDHQVEVHDTFDELKLHMPEAFQHLTMGPQEELDDADLTETDMDRIEDMLGDSEAQADFLTTFYAQQESKRRYALEDDITQQLTSSEEGMVDIHQIDCLGQACVFYLGANSGWQLSKQLESMSENNSGFFRQTHSSTRTDKKTGQHLAIVRVKLRDK